MPARRRPLDGVLEPQGYSGLADGSHAFQVRATDAAGLTDPTPASHSWTVDTSAPNMSFDDVPADPSNDDAPTFSSPRARAARPSSAASTAAPGRPARAPRRSIPSPTAVTRSRRARSTRPETPTAPRSHTWTADTVTPTRPSTTSRPTRRMTTLPPSSSPRARAAPRLSAASTAGPGTVHQPRDGRPARRRQPHVRRSRDRRGRQRGDDARVLHVGRRRFPVRLDHSAKRLRGRSDSDRTPFARRARRRRVRHRVLQLLERERRLRGRHLGLAWDRRDHALRSLVAARCGRKSRAARRRHRRRVLHRLQTSSTSRSTARRPATTIDAAPSDPASSTDASVEFSSSEGGSTF